MCEKTINTFLSDASLQQNIPNPFTNTTAIRQPFSKFKNVQIIITDNRGKTVKQVNVSRAGKGVVIIDASMLSLGSYHYSLVIDGKLVGSKQMVLAK